MSIVNKLKVTRLSQLKIDADKDWNNKNITGLGSLFPYADNSKDLGSSSLRWKNCYLSGNLTLSSLTSGSILFAGSGGVISQNPTNLYWDDVSKRLGVKTSSLVETLTVAGDLGLRDGSLWQTVYPSDDGLVLYLPFSEGVGTKTYDKSPYGNDGTISGAAWVDGKYGKALSFDGVDDYVNCGSASSLELSSAFTLEGWFKFEPGVSGGRGFVHKGLSTNDYDYTLYLSASGYAAVQFRNPAGNTFGAAGSVDIRDGLWHHWAGTFDGRYLRMYVDGTLVRETDTNGTTVRTTTSNLKIGYGFNGYTKMLADEVRVYSRALSAEEIKAHYLQGLQSNGYIKANSFKIIDTSGVELLRVTQNGLGIGTVPYDKLHIGSAGASYARIRLTTSGQPANPAVFLSAKYTTAADDFGLSGYFGSLKVDGSLGIGTWYSHPLILATNSLERMRIDSVGNVGIGTASPSERLHVAGNLRIDDGYYLKWSDTNLYRSAADVLKTDDNFDALSLRIGGTEVISSARALQNVSADAGIITSGVFDVARIPDLDASKITSGVFNVARMPQVPTDKLVAPTPTTEYQTPYAVSASSQSGGDLTLTSYAYWHTLYYDSYTRLGERVYAANIGGKIVRKVGFFLYKSGNPTGTLYARVRRADTDEIVAELGSLDVSTLTTSPAWYWFSGEWTMPTGVDLRFLAEYSGGNGTNYVNFAYDSNLVAWGCYTTYFGSYSDNTSYDATIQILTQGLASNAKDDDTATYWMPSPPNESGAWIRFQLSQDYLAGVAGCRIYHNSDANYRPQAYKVQASVDGSTWEDVYVQSTQPPAGWIEHSWYAKPNMLYLRILITQHGSSGTKINEFDYYQSNIWRHGHGWL